MPAGSVREIITQQARAATCETIAEILPRPGRPSQCGHKRSVADTTLRGLLGEATLRILSEGIADRSSRDERASKLFWLPQIERYPPFNSLFMLNFQIGQTEKRHSRGRGYVLPPCSVNAIEHYAIATNLHRAEVVRSDISDRDERDDNQDGEDTV